MQNQNLGKRTSRFVCHQVSTKSSTPSEKTPTPWCDMKLLRSDLFWEPKKNFSSTAPLSKAWAASTKLVPLCVTLYWTVMNPAQLPLSYCHSLVTFILSGSIYSGFVHAARCVFLWQIRPSSQNPWAAIRSHQTIKTVRISFPLLLLDLSSSSTNLLLRTLF